MARVPYILLVAVVVGLAAALSSPLPAQSRALLPSGGIIGRVIDQQSQLPLGGAMVSLLGTPLQLATDSGGRFTQAGLRPGTYLIEVRAIGYGLNSWILKLKDGEVVDYTFAIAPLGVDLEPVTVEARPAYAQRRLQEFEQRRHSGRGVFITEEQIKTSHAATMADLLRAVPGVRLNCRSGNCTAQMTRGARGICAADWVLDGLPATMSSTPALPVVGIVGIEIYRSPGEAPAEFLKADSQCGVIAIWTKSGP
ncbi:MAG TPA: carboxypeptidase regulatory-like domain-containing protein [Gemmatimonadales bacterium]|nr:carboxypeptidase regulatory-like domain-containing protein [Gemmatimonadales bacterium]